MVSAGPENPEQPLVSIMLFETDLREALNEISLQTGINIIPDQTVSGTVTADIQDKPLEEALMVILTSGGYTFRKINDFYLVGLADPRSTTFGRLVETQIVELQHRTVDQVQAILPAYLQSYVRGDRQTNVLSIAAPPEELAEIRRFIGEIDTPRKQVEVKVVVTEVSSQAIKELGSNLLDFSAQKGQETNPNWTGSISYDGKEGLLTLESDVYGTLLAKLRMLQEDHQAKIHADPRVLLADGETAELFTGDRQIILLKPDDEDTTSRIERIEVGLNFKVKADIIGEDQVILNLSPEISYFLNEARPDLIIKRNSIITTVRLHNGQTAALAGLTIQDSSSYTKKTPLLGSIPLIRWLFRNDIDREANKELMIFVTPVIQ